MTDLAPPPGDDLDALRRDAVAELAAAADLRAWDAARPTMVFDDVSRVVDDLHGEEYASWGARRG